MIDLWDAEQPGLLLRVRPSGAKTFLVFYRAGSGRKAPQRFYRLGNADAISLKDARAAAKAVLGNVVTGADPHAERKAETKRARRRLAPALDAYEADLQRRKVVKRAEVMSLLRRELLASLGNVDLDNLERATLVERVRAIEQSGRPGAAKELRTRAGVFLSWCVDEGLLKASPLAGWRRPRRTRAERLEEPGRALSDAELPAVWEAAEAEGWPFGPYLQMLLLLGQRRTETAAMRWSDLDLSGDGAAWIIPREVTKSVRAHRVPLPGPAVEILRRLPRRYRVDLVFPGRHGTPMAGWSKRLAPVYRRTRAAGLAHWTPHDLRRTMRTGLGRLGVDPVIAELMLNHAISDDLARIYDRHDYWLRRVEAAEQWAAHVMAQVHKVVPLQRRRGA